MLPLVSATYNRQSSLLDHDNLSCITPCFDDNNIQYVLTFLCSIQGYSILIKLILTHQRILQEDTRLKLTNDSY